MTEPLTLYYAHDPMCSFCWAFRPTWQKVKAQLAEHNPEIQIRNLLGGLAPDSQEPMTAETKLKVQGAWRYIEQHIPGTRFNHLFWETQKPRRSTYPSCRAVIAVKMLSPQLEEKMILAIQQAYYLNAQNPSDIEPLVQCAHSIGLNEALFERTLLSDECNSGLMEELEFTRSIGINSFPSLVMARDSRRFSIPVEYNSAEKQFDSLRQIATLL